MARRREQPEIARLRPQQDEEQRAQRKYSVVEMRAARDGAVQSVTELVHPFFHVQEHLGDASGDEVECVN